MTVSIELVDDGTWCATIDWTPAAHVVVGWYTTFMDAAHAVEAYFEQHP